MNIFSFKFPWKLALIKVVEIFSIAVITSLFIGIYLLGLIQGFTEGKKQAQEEFLAYIEDLSQAPTPTPKPTVSTTPIPTKKVIVTYEVNWGGPELWTAVNNRRTDFGVNSLEQRDELCTIASIRLNELLELGKLDGHEGFSNMSQRRPDLKWIFDKYSTIAEFLAVGGRTPEETVSLWEGTLGHKKLLTGGEYVWGCIYAQNTFAIAITAF